MNERWQSLHFAVHRLLQSKEYDALGHLLQASDDELCEVILKHEGRLINKTVASTLEWELVEKFKHRVPKLYVHYALGGPSDPHEEVEDRHRWNLICAASWALFLAVPAFLIFGDRLFK